MATQRTTDKQLDAIAGLINTVLKAPEAPYMLVGDRHTAQIGNYHISHAYGGVCLHRMGNLSGGVSDVFSCGHIPKRELAERMYAFLRGLEVAQEVAA